MNIDFKQLVKNSKENRKSFQTVLKKSQNAKTIRQLPSLHEQAFEKINCLNCANCCKNYSPRFKDPDIKRVSKHLRMKESQFIQSYLIIDNDGDYVLQQNPCHFLNEDNTCSIYEVRPRDCQRYPYTDEDVLVKQIPLTIKNTEICPATFEVVKMLESLSIK